MTPTSIGLCIIIVIAFAVLLVDDWADAIDKRNKSLSASRALKDKKGKRK